MNHGREALVAADRGLGNPTSDASSDRGVGESKHVVAGRSRDSATESRAARATSAAEVAPTDIHGTSTPAARPAATAASAIAARARRAVDAARRKTSTSTLVDGSGADIHGPSATARGFGTRRAHDAPPSSEVGVSRSNGVARRRQNHFKAFESATR